MAMPAGVRAWLASLLFLLTIRNSVACKLAQAEVLNVLNVSSKLAEYANRAIAGRLPRTLGDCSGIASTDPSLQPCHTLPAFPLKGTGFNFEYSINYLTHVDTFTVRNITARCSEPGEPSSDNKSHNNTDDGECFAEFASAFTEMSVGATVKVLFPEFILEAPCADKSLCLAAFEEIPFRAAARVTCLGPELLGLRVDPSVGIQMGKPMALSWHGHSINFTSLVSDAFGKIIEQVELPCPAGGPALFCRALCAADIPAPLAKAMDSLMLLV